MDCGKIAILISLKLDHMLTDSQQTEIDAHLSQCPNCKAEYDNLKELTSAIKDLQDVQVPAGFREEIMRAIRVQSLLSEEEDISDAGAAKKKPFIKQKYIFGGAAAACLFLVAMFTLSGIMSTKSSIFLTGGGGSGAAPQAAAPAYEEASAPAEAPAPEAPMAEMAASDTIMGDRESGYPNDMDYADDSANLALAGEAQAEAEDTRVKEDMPQKQKIIKTSNYNIEVDDFDSTVATIQQLAQSSGGYVESFNSSIYATYDSALGPRDAKTGFISIKVPYDQYNATKIRIEDLGKVTNTDESSDNITSQYMDTTARLEAKKTEEQRLLDLIGKAEDIDDLIALETRLNYVRSDIESMESQIKNWDVLVAYSTINISITEKTQYNVAVDPTLSEQISEAFKRSLSNFIYNSERLLIFFIENSIALFIFSVFVIAGIKIVRLLVKGNKTNDDDI